MCYAIPGKVIDVKGKIATVEYFGEKRKVLNNFIKVKIGDYVYAQGGIIIDKIPVKDAIEILTFWKEQFFELKKKDIEISNSLDRNFYNEKKNNLLEIFQKINLKKELSFDELITLLKIEDENELKTLYQIANNIRQKEHGNSSCIHGIIEFSNYCRNNCYYCGIRKDRNLKRYRMTPEEIFKRAEYAVKELGFKALVLQSGEDLYYNEEILIDIVKRLRKLNILIFLSIGVRDLKIYEKLYKAGARAFLLRFETSNKKIFEKLRPDTSFEERIEAIKNLKRIGYIIATGFLIGLPEESYEDIINNIFLAKSFEPEMYSFGPFIPALDTPLEKSKIVNENLVLKTIAITRIIDRNSNILVTTALETLNKDAKRKGLLAGANSLMINLTPSEYKPLYEIYPNRPKLAEIESIRENIELLYNLGRAPTDLGISEKMSLPDKAY